LTRAISIERGPSVRINAVVPGAVETAMLGFGLERSGQTLEEKGARLALDRVASPRDVAKVIRFVAIEATMMTGSTVVVDGGALARLSSE
jgi:NAD(P)-dependent dehydrogenase (short-subunit alcohol dehydrogenase family)